MGKEKQLQRTTFREAMRSESLTFQEKFMLAVYPIAGFAVGGLWGGMQLFDAAMKNQDTSLGLVAIKAIGVAVGTIIIGSSPMLGIMAYNRGWLQPRPNTPEVLPGNGVK